MPGNGFNNPIDPALPSRDPNKPLSTTAVRVPAHSENQSNTGKPVNSSRPTPNFGNLGIGGDGRSK